MMNHRPVARREEILEAHHARGPYFPPLRLKEIHRELGFLSENVVRHHLDRIYGRRGYRYKRSVRA
jgi:hypothetical protein